MMGWGGVGVMGGGRVGGVLVRGGVGGVGEGRWWCG